LRQDVRAKTVILELFGTPTKGGRRFFSVPIFVGIRRSKTKGPKKSRKAPCWLYDLNLRYRSTEMGRPVERKHRMAALPTTWGVPRDPCVPADAPCRNACAPPALYRSPAPIFPLALRLPTIVAPGSRAIPGTPLHAGGVHSASLLEWTHSNYR